MASTIKNIMCGKDNDDRDKTDHYNEQQHHIYVEKKKNKIK